mgnify:CR=1 FL=1
MSFPLSIVIWDYNPERIAEIDRNLHLALRELNLRGTVSSLSEPPLMSREGLVGREPVRRCLLVLTAGRNHLQRSLPQAAFTNRPRKGLKP